MNGALKILERVIAASPDTITPDLAHQILSFEFAPEDHARYAILNEKAGLGTLSKSEEIELDDYIDADTTISILKARARASQQKRTTAA